MPHSAGFVETFYTASALCHTARFYFDSIDANLALCVIAKD
jgi:hypothetical protein